MDLAHLDFIQAFWVVKLPLDKWQAGACHPFIFQMTLCFPKSILPWSQQLIPSLRRQKGLPEAVVIPIKNAG